jgi:peptide/nickel transport system substrate-binding protein
MSDKLALTRRTVFGLAVGLIAGARGMATAARAATCGGKVIYGLQEDCKILDPLSAELNADIWLMTNLYGMLLEPSADGKSPQPGLATKWDWSNGGKTLTLALRGSVKFADGSPFSADDVKFTLERAASLKDGPWIDLVSAIDHVDIADPLKVTVNLKNPDPALLAVLGMFVTSILPKAAVMTTPGATVEDKMKQFVNKPIGTGPFVMSEWRRDDVMRVQRNPYF